MCSDGLSALRATLEVSPQLDPDSIVRVFHFLFHFPFSLPSPIRTSPNAVDGSKAIHFTIPLQSGYILWHAVDVVLRSIRNRLDYKVH